jgi:hypothetical protein
MGQADCHSEIICRTADIFTYPQVMQGVKCNLRGGSICVAFPELSQEVKKCHQRVQNLSALVVFSDVHEAEPSKVAGDQQ